MSLMLDARLTNKIDKMLGDGVTCSRSSWEYSITQVGGLPGLSALWAETLGDPRVCVAVLDGPVDSSHPCFDGVNLSCLPTLAAESAAISEPASAHGTAVTSVIFGSHDSAVKGVAPGCRALIVPVFSEGTEETLGGCSQPDLARAVLQAVEGGAHVINISGGQLTPSGDPDPMLAQAVRLCADRNVLIVAAAGNDGCQCLHVPAAIQSVLAVGATDSEGLPIESTNWGGSYRTHGVLAPGKNIVCAVPGGQTATLSGTSFAAPIVSGVAALLASVQLLRGMKPDPQGIRAAILKTALPCDPREGLDCRRFLSGRLNVPAAYRGIIGEGMKQMSDDNVFDAGEPQQQPSPLLAAEAGIAGSPPLTESETALASAESAAISTRGAKSGTQSLHASPAIAPAADRNDDKPAAQGARASADCGCEGGEPTSLVYALGTLFYDFPTEAERDRFIQFMPSRQNNPFVPEQLLSYLDQAPYDAQALTWTLNVDATPIYAITPCGPYANLAFERLREFLRAQFAEREDERTEVNSVPGVLSGQVRLFTGHVVPKIIPELRGMFSWSVERMIQQALGAPPAPPAEGAAPTERETYDAQVRAYEQRRAALRNFVNRIYYGFRNLGVAASDRALNYAATNAFQVQQVWAIEEQDTPPDRRRGDLRTIDVHRSPICRPDSDCYDVQLRYFNPNNILQSNRIFQFTVDVSAVMPVSIGVVRTWYE